MKPQQGLLLSKRPERQYISNLVDKALRLPRQNSHDGLMDLKKEIIVPCCNYSVSNTAGGNLIGPFIP